MTPSASIEPARAEDAAEFIVLRGRTRENAVSETRLAAMNITAGTWAEDIRYGVLVGFTARRQAALVGYCFGDTRSGEVIVLALLPDAEGQGIGRRLLDRVVSSLRALGHRRLFLGCSSDPRARSHGFYRHLGWRPTGVVDRHGDEVLELDVAADTSLRPA